MRFANPNCAFLGLLSDLASDIECVLCVNEGSLAIEFTYHRLWYMKLGADRVEINSSLWPNVGRISMCRFHLFSEPRSGRTFKFCKGLRKVILKARACEEKWRKNDGS